MRGSWLSTSVFAATERLPCPRIDSLPITIDVLLKTDYEYNFRLPVMLSWPMYVSISPTAYFNYFQNKCLDVQGAVFANGTPVQM